MFKPITGLPMDVVGLSATGTITGDDYEHMLIPLMRDTMAAHGKVRMLLHFGPDFTGYSASAMWEDTKFGLTHLGDFSRLAVVTDVAWLRHAVRLFAPFMRCPVSVFANNDMETAKAWIAS
jgi:SpoIIAA-like